MKILLVDDSKTVTSNILDNLKDRISDKNLEIFTATSKKECADLILEHKSKFDIAILDLGLPDAPNGEVVSFVDKFNIPFIILSGTTLDKNSKLLSLDNLIDYVLKNGTFSIEYTSYLVDMFISNKNYEVLIVDDSKSFAYKAQALCKRYNLDAIVKHSGAEALEELKENDKIKLILIDYMMPDMNGLELTTKVRVNFKKDDLCIIAVSSTKDKEIVAKFLKYGANDFIYKDFSNEEFYARLNSNLEIIKLFKKSKDRANKDYLTGMFNRRYLFEEGSKIYKHTRSEHGKLSLAIIDIDKFKNINDTYGHDIGDIAIKHIPSILANHLKKDSLISRMGGEEFCIITKDLNEEEILALYEDIRASFENSVLSIKDLNLKFTVSIGVCTKYHSDLDDMMRKADEALYTAKETGRNRVILHK